MTFGQMYPPVVTSCGLVWNYFGQDDLWSDVPPVETSHGQVWYYFGKDDLWSDVLPPVVQVSGQVHIFVRSVGQADLWSDVPPQ